jgi:hypothetical protein
MVLLRIAVVVGLIFWFSPLRQPWNRTEAPHASDEPPGPSEAGAPDRDRIGHLVRAWERLPPEGRAAVRDAVGRLPDIAGSSQDSSAAPPKTAPAAKPRGTSER